MEDNKIESKYPPSSYGSSHQQGYDSLPHQKIPVRNAPYAKQENDQFEDNGVENEAEEDEELGDEEDENEQDNGFNNTHEDENLNEEDDDDDDDDDDNEEEDVEGDGIEDDDKRSITRKSNNVETERHPKKRRLKNLVSNYEFAPRVPPSSAAASSVSKPSFGGRNSLTDWTEHETLVLLDAWGDRFLQQGRKSLRSEEWQEVAEKVSEVSKIERTDAQCRNRLDTLKKKYKTEKAKLKETYASTSRWDYFKKMDMLMSSPPQQGGLSCGLDSGEYVFMNPIAYLNRANGLDEMRDSPGNSNSAGEEDSDELPAKRAKNGRNNNQGSSYKLLADSILKFSEIYEKIENSRRQQMIELEKMRMNFHKELEIQKKEIMERAKIEIAKIPQMEDEET